MPNEFVVVEIISPTQLIIAGGTREGVALGQEFLIFGRGKPLKNPDTGEDLGVPELIRGTGRVIHVQEKLATLESDRVEERPTRISRTESSGSIFPIFRSPVEQHYELQRIRLEFDGAQIGDFARRRASLKLGGSPP